VAFWFNLPSVEDLKCYPSVANLFLPADLDLHHTEPVGHMVLRSHRVYLKPIDIRFRWEVHTVGQILGLL